MKGQSNVSWIEQEFSEIDCSDLRLNKRFIHVAKLMMESPGENIHAAMKDWKSSKGAYRLFDNKHLSRNEILSIHASNVLKRIESTAGEEAILAIQDSTSFSLSHHPKTTGMGELIQLPGYSKPVKGFHCHHTFLMTEAGLPLGLLKQDLFQNKFPKVSHKERPIFEKKSYRWLEGLQSGQEVKPKTLIHICDREADIYEFFLEAEDCQQNYIVRRAMNRKLDKGGTLLQEINQAPVQCKLKINIPGNGARKKRQAKLNVAWAKLTLKPPQRTAKANYKPLRSVCIYAVMAKEIAAVEKPLSWLLLSNLPIADKAEAIQCIKRYKLRWHVEEFHKVLKSACRIEKCRLQTFERLDKFIALMSVIAFRLYFMSLMNRVFPKASGQIILQEHEWQALCLNNLQYIPEEPPNVRETIRMIGRLGGFLGRNSDAEPGITVIWRGWSKLKIMSEFFLKAKRCG